MKTPVKIIPVALLLLAASAAISEVKTWTSATGTSIQAEFISKAGNMVTLRTPEGKTAVVPISALAAESQAQIPATASTPSPAADSAPGTISTPRATLGANRGPKAVGGLAPPTAEEIAAFKTDFTDTDGSRYAFHASFHPQTLSKKDAEKAARLGKIPFRVTCSLDKFKLVGGKMRSVTMEGNGYIVVLDEQGEVVASKRENLAKLCPS